MNRRHIVLMVMFLASTFFLGVVYAAENAVAQSTKPAIVRT